MKKLIIAILVLWVGVAWAHESNPSEGIITWDKETEELGVDESDAMTIWVDEEAIVETPVYLEIPVYNDYICDYCKIPTGDGNMVLVNNDYETVGVICTKCLIKVFDKVLKEEEKDEVTREKAWCAAFDECTWNGSSCICID